MVFERIEAAGVKEVKVGGQSWRSKLKVVCLAAEGFVDDNSSTSSIFSTAKALTLYSFQVFSSRTVVLPKSDIVLRSLLGKILSP